MNSPASDIANLLQTAGHGTFAASSGWSINISREPAKPDTCITIYDTGGYDPFGYGAEQPTIQVRVRGVKGGYATAYSKAKAIRDYLIEVNRTSVGGVIYSTIQLQGDLSSIGYDDSERPLFVSNYTIIRGDQ